MFRLSGCDFRLNRVIFLYRLTFDMGNDKIVKI